MVIVNVLIVFALFIGLYTLEKKLVSFGKRILIALFAFIVYYNLMTLGQNWVGAGRMGLVSFMLLLHGGMLLASLLVLAARHNQWSIHQLWRPQPQPGSAP